MDEIFMVHYFMTKAFVYIEGGEGGTIFELTNVMG